MAASAWTIFDQAKHKIGDGTIDLSGGVFRLALYATASSANMVGDITIQSSIGNESSGGGYPLGGTTLGSIVWTAGASAGEQKFDGADPIFTASASVLSAVRYAVIVQSLGATSGHLLCFAALSTSEFNITSGNTLTVQFASTGIFTLA